MDCVDFSKSKLIKASGFVQFQVPPWNSEASALGLGCFDSLLLLLFNNVSLASFWYQI